MKKTPTKITLLASLLSFAPVAAIPALRAQDSTAGGPPPASDGPAPAAASPGDPSANSATAGKPAPKKKRKRKRKKKAPAGDNAPSDPGNGPAAGSGESSSEITPAK
ncbi:MAG: hypothetical protein ABSA05_07290 [Opitutaceae bacterium]|jgi:hypothetical protein